MDKCNQSRNKNFINKASITRNKTHLTYQDRIAKRVTNKSSLDEESSLIEYYKKRISHPNEH